MSTILKNYTPEQYYELMKNKVIADNVGLTNFNPGSNTRSILEAVGFAVSTIGFDFLESIRQSIPIALFDGLDFGRKVATPSNGYLRFYRLPLFHITYTGSDSSVTITTTTLQMELTTSGTPGDDMVIDYATYDTIQKIIDQINTHGSWSATRVLNTGTPSDIYIYTSRVITGNTNYINLSNTVDIMTTAAVEVIIQTSAQAQIDNIIVSTTNSSTIPAGDATSPNVAAQSLQTGDETNMDAQAINTLIGNGVLNTPIIGVEYVINDSAFANGDNAETDEERASRFQTYIQGLTQGTTKGLESAILKIQGIKSVTIKERTPIPGTNTVIADDGTGNLSIAQIDEIRKVIEGDPDNLNDYPGVGLAGINYNIEAPTLVPLNIVATIYRIGTISDSIEIKLACQSAIERYINTRRLGYDVVVSEIIKRAKASHPACYDFALTTPTSNVSIDSNEIPRVGSGTGASVNLTLITLTSIP